MKALPLTLALLAALPVAAEPVGRYQAVVIQGTSPTGPAAGGKQDARVLILDTVEGHLWTWSENELLAEGGGRRFGTALVYQGRVQPGRHLGEVIDRYFP
jgi:hypothetical protein